MTTNETTDKQPLWLLIEEKILALSSGDLEAGKLEQTIDHMAKALDDTGHNVSKNGGNLLHLNWKTLLIPARQRPVLQTVWQIHGLHSGSMIAKLISFRLSKKPDWICT
jgi:hypothetical protein